MIIDFKELSALIPEKGSLILTLKRSNGNLTVCYAPRYDGKEENSEFRPVTVTGTPEELNEEWNKTISEIAKNEHLLITASSTSNLSKRKTETEKALIKTSKTATMVNKKTDNSGPSSDNSLFTPAKKDSEQKHEVAENNADGPAEESQSERDDTETYDIFQQTDTAQENERPQEQKTTKPTIF